MDEEKDQHVTAAPVTSESVELEDDKKPWQMPEPVFRKSSGYLPKRFENRIAGETAAAETSIPVVADGNGAASAAAAPLPAAAVQPSGDIQPQPDLTEEDPADEMSTSAPAKPERSPGMKIFLALLGIAAMIVFALAFIAVIYYLFFYYPGDSTQF